MTDPVSGAPLIGILALQGDVREHAHALAACGASTREIRKPDELSGIDGLVIPGGESTTMSLLARTTGLLDPIRALIAEGLPAYGSCAGLVMLAERVLDGRPDQVTFGGLDVTVRRNAFGRQVDSFETDIDIDDIGTMHAVFIRAPWVEQAGEGVRVLGSVSGSATHGADTRIVAVRQGSVVATSFHPELTGDLRFHEYFVSIVKDRQATNG